VLVARVPSRHWNVPELFEALRSYFRRGIRAFVSFGKRVTSAKLLLPGSEICEFPYGFSLKDHYIGE
jgi:hypothetical protein